MTHRTADFRIGLGDYVCAAGALAAFWSHETVEMDLVRDGEIVIRFLREVFAVSLGADRFARQFGEDGRLDHPGVIYLEKATTAGPPEGKVSITPYSERPPEDRSK